MRSKIFFQAFQSIKPMLSPATLSKTVQNTGKGVLAIGTAGASILGTAEAIAKYKDEFDTGASFEKHMFNAGRLGLTVLGNHIQSPAVAMGTNILLFGINVVAEKKATGNEPTLRDCATFIANSVADKSKVLGQNTLGNILSLGATTANSLYSNPHPHLCNSVCQIFALINEDPNKDYILIL